MILALALAISAMIMRSRGPLPVHDTTLETDEAFEQARKKRRRYTILGILGLWLSSGLFLGLFTKTKETFSVTISPGRVDILGFSTSTSVVISWIVIAGLVLVAALIRFFVIPQFKA